MRRFLGMSILGIIIICSLCVVNSSSGILLFHANRGVEMRVVNSENAFISLPDVICLNIIATKQTVKCYILSPIPDLGIVKNIAEAMNTEDLAENTKTNQNTRIKENAGYEENIESGEIKEAKCSLLTEEKAYVKTEKTIKIDYITNSFKIKNNMVDEIELVNITFNDHRLKANNDSIILERGKETNIFVEYSDIDVDILNDNILEESQAILCFEWDKGRSTIYKNVLVNVEIKEETLEQQIVEQIVEVSDANE